MFHESSPENNDLSESGYRNHAGHVARNESRGTRAETPPSNSHNQYKFQQSCTEQHEREEGDDLEEQDDEGNTEEQEGEDYEEDEDNAMPTSVDEEFNDPTREECDVPNTTSGSTCTAHTRKKKASKKSREG